MASLRTARILARLTTWRTPPEIVCGQLLDLCVGALGVDGSSLVLMGRTGPPGVVAVSDAVAQAVEEAQFVLGDGPGIDCVRSAAAVLEPDLAVTGVVRWPGFAGAASAAGAGAVFVLPLTLGHGDRPLGALGLYCRAAGPLRPEAVLKAAHYAAAATTLLLHLQATHGALGDHVVSGLLLRDQAYVAQASGVVAVQTGVTVMDALVVLRARAFTDATPVAALARAVLRREVVFNLIK